MSAEAARAAEILLQLSSPARLSAFAELVKAGNDGATLFELSIHLDRPKPEVGEICGRLVGAGLATGTGNGTFRARGDVLREAAQALVRVQPITPLLAGYPQLKSCFAHGRLASLPPTMSERYQQIGEILARVKADGVTVLLIEQNLRFATTLADRHYLIAEGRIVQQLANSEVVQREHELLDYLGV